MSRHWVSMVSNRHRWPPIGPLTRFAVMLLLLLLSSTAVVAWTAAASPNNSDYYFDGKNYYYSLFRNNFSVTNFPDGVSGVGRYGAVGFGAAFDATGVVFSDMTRGSRVRKITSTGHLYTITGSNTENGCVAGDASTARFGGALSTAYVNAIISASGGYYIADSQCSSLRFINATTNVTTNIRTFSSTQQSRPAALAKTPYANTAQSNIYITDPANGNIRFLTLNTPITAIEGTIQSGDNIFQPIGIALLPSIHRIVATNLGLDFIYLDYTSTAASSASVQWSKLSNYTTANPLVTSYNGLNVLYISGNNIMSMPVNTAVAIAGAATPSTVFTFTPLSTAETGTSNPESMLLFAPRSADSYYILTTHRYLIASATPITAASSSSSSSNSNEVSSTSTTTTTTTQEPTTSTTTTTTQEPTTSSTTTTTTTQEPTTSTTTTTTQEPTTSSTTTTTTTQEPTTSTTTTTTQEPTTSSTTTTTTTQEPTSSTPTPTTTQEPTTSSIPTPTINTTTTAFPTSPPTPRESSCDDVCKGAIASSVVMACAGIVLIVLMVIAPANLRTAIIMVPII